MNTRKRGKPVLDRRSIRIFLPFVLLLLSFTALSIAKQQNSRNKKNNNVESAPASIIPITKDAAIVHELTPDPTNLSSSTPTAAVISQDNGEPTASEIPTRFPNDSIVFIGPPSNSIFSLQTPVTIYWDWPFYEDQNQLFAVYLMDDSGEYLAGTADEPSLGNRGYQLNFIPRDTVNSEGPYLIEIRLQQMESLAVLAVSNPRSIEFTLEHPG